MNSFYTIVRFLPDPLAEEQINIGVIAFGEGQVYARFIERWKRVSNFTGEADIGFLQDFARRVEEGVSSALVLEGMSERYNLDEEQIRHFAGSWTNSIQLSEPRASVLPADELVSFIYGRFIREDASAPPAKRGRSRVQAASALERRLRRVLEAQVPEMAAELLHRKAPLQGSIEAHEFDAVIKNGSPYLAAQGFTFELQDQRDVAREIDALAYALSDVRKTEPELPMSVVAFFPKEGRSPLVDRTRRICNQLSITLMPDDEVEDWASGIIRSVLP